MEKIYYNIRILKAKSKKKAIEKIEDSDGECFLETHEHSDIVVSKTELIKLLKKDKK